MRTGVSAFNATIVSPSFADTMASLKAVWLDASGVHTKRLPICTPSAPNTMVASILLPVAMPPAAISGISIAARTAGIRQSVVVSSRPLCPPASKPSATTASTPASWHLMANFALDTTCTTVMPASLSFCVQVLGLPAEVNTMGTFSSSMVFMCSSIDG
jgi:hypothetical protein